MPSPRYIGVLLAAGRGRRMGGIKQLKLWPSANGAKPLICAAYDAIRPICDDCVVVLGHEADAIADALGDRPFCRAKSCPDEPMFESMRVGFQAALAIDPAAIIVLQPGDHPEVSSATLHNLTTASLERPSQAIIPEFNGRGGHPVLIPAHIATTIATRECPNGLAQFWSEHPGTCYRLNVNDAAVLRDVDTPADLTA